MYVHTGKDVLIIGLYLKKNRIQTEEYLPTMLDLNPLPAKTKKHLFYIIEPQAEMKSLTPNDKWVTSSGKKNIQREKLNGNREKHSALGSL